MARLRLAPDAAGHLRGIAGPQGEPLQQLVQSPGHRPGPERRPRFLVRAGRRDPHDADPDDLQQGRFQRAGDRVHRRAVSRHRSVLARVAPHDQRRHRHFSELDEPRCRARHRRRHRLSHSRCHLHQRPSRHRLGRGLRKQRLQGHPERRAAVRATRPARAAPRRRLTRRRRGRGHSLQRRHRDLDHADAGDRGRRRDGDGRNGHGVFGQLRRVSASDRRGKAAAGLPHG